jgi:hypothetical protein
MKILKYKALKTITKHPLFFIPKFDCPFNLCMFYVLCANSSIIDTLFRSRDKIFTKTKKKIMQITLPTTLMGKRYANEIGSDLD